MMYLPLRSCYRMVLVNLYLQPHQVQTIYVLVKKLGMIVNSGGNYNVVVGDEAGGAFDHW